MQFIPWRVLIFNNGLFPLNYCRLAKLIAPIVRSLSRASRNERERQKLTFFWEQRSPPPPSPRKRTVSSAFLSLSPFHSLSLTFSCLSRPVDRGFLLLAAAVLSSTPRVRSKLSNYATTIKSRAFVSPVIVRHGGGRRPRGGKRSGEAPDRKKVRGTRRQWGPRWNNGGPV